MVMSAAASLIRSRLSVASSGGAATRMMMLRGGATTNGRRCCLGTCTQLPVQVAGTAAGQRSMQLLPPPRHRSSLAGYNENSGTETWNFISSTINHHRRHFSSVMFDPSPPDELTAAMAEGILETTQFYVKHGISNQRLKKLAKEHHLGVTEKWHKMMEIYFGTQVHVISGLGYPANEEGLSLYVTHLQKCMEKETDDTMRALFTDVRKDTWRLVVATTFEIDPNDITKLSIVDARNLMHKVSSAMIEPSTLLQIQQETAGIREDTAELELTKKHQIMQKILVNTVYLGGSPSLVEEAGFGSGPAAYAKMQCALTDHEGDPLMAQYAGAAMVKIFDAAGIDIESISGPGINKPAQPVG